MDAEAVVYLWHECPACTHSMVVPADPRGYGCACPQCWGDFGTEIEMDRRMAHASDKPTGQDFRLTPAIRRFRCYGCGFECLAATNEEQAMADFIAHHGRPPIGKIALVCADCYRRALQ